jgi:Putative Flp pilus-assembly TadE/G-like
MLVLFSLILVLLLMCGAIAIDVGYWWANAKKAQIAADSCALAAAQSIPDIDPTGTECVIEAGGPDYVLANIPPQDGTSEPLHTGTNVVWPYKSDASKVEATVNMKVGTFFGRVIGMGGIKLTRRAVAIRAEGDGNYAIYSHSFGCPDHGNGNSLRFNGEHHSINGRVHSNGEYFIHNQGAEPFWAKIGTRVDCVSIQPHDSARFGGDGYATGQTKPDTVPMQTWPGWFTPAEFGWVDHLDAMDSCNVKGKKILIKEDGGNTRIEVDTPIGVMPQLVFPGNVITQAYTYCATESFQINRPNLIASLTALSPKIGVDGENQQLSAARSGADGPVLFFAVPNIDASQDGALPAGDPSCEFGPAPNPEMILNDNRHQWTGTIFNPCGRIVVNVGGSTIGTPALTGTILGFQVHVNGRDFIMVGKDSFGGDAALALFE